MRAHIGVGLLVALAGWASPAGATYSVVAADGRTGEVGGASTSCVNGFSVGIIYAGVPGVGVVHAQALVNQNARDEAQRLLGEGTSASDALSAITAPSFDPNAAERQYLIATVDEVVAFTGDGSGFYAGDLRGQVADIRYAVAGNILTGAPVLERAGAAFAAGGCDLAERFVLALEAGAENGEGDGRCTPDRPSTSAYVRIEGATPDTPRLELEVVDSFDPLAALRSQYESWRQGNPCPEPGGVGGAGGEGVVGGGDAGGGAAKAPAEADEARSEAGCGMAVKRSGPGGAAAPGRATPWWFLGAMAAALALAARRAR